MHHREITLADGRYMVFYTFGESRSGEAETRAEPGGKDTVAPAAGPGE